MNFFIIPLKVIGAQPSYNAHRVMSLTFPPAKQLTNINPYILQSTFDFSILLFQVSKVYKYYTHTYTCTHRPDGLAPSFNVADLLPFVCYYNAHEHLL